MNELALGVSAVIILLLFLLAYIILRTKIEIKPITVFKWCILFYAVAEIRNFVFGLMGWSITEYVMQALGL